MCLRPSQPILAPSILSADYIRLADTLEMLRYVDRCNIHVDVMDGVFVPNITIGIPVVAALRRGTNINLDCHLMITNPARYVLEFAKAGANHICIHYEADPHSHKTLNDLRLLGVKAGIAINPGTPVEVITDLVGNFDFAVIMSVNPGFGGQTFITRAMDKIKRLDAIRTKTATPFLIEVDGGITLDNAAAVVAAGADMVVAGNAIFESKDPLKNIEMLISEMDAGRQTSY